MTISSKRNFCVLTVLCFALLNIFLFYHPYDVLADDPPLQPEGYSSVETSKSIKVLITNKDGNTIVTMDDHSFPVLHDAIILDADGNKIQLSELPVPCEATIRYRRLRR
jgi:hypothetical protein